jgi:hypothetical protein
MQCGAFSTKQAVRPFTGKQGARAGKWAEASLSKLLIQRYHFSVFDPADFGPLRLLVRVVCHPAVFGTRLTRQSKISLFIRLHILVRGLIVIRFVDEVKRLDVRTLIPNLEIDNAVRSSGENDRNYTQKSFYKIAAIHLFSFQAPARYDCCNAEAPVSTDGGFGPG